jgi:hypothetical protein
MIDLTKFIEEAHIYSFQENRGQFVFDDFSEKLAELIVRECVGVADDYVKGCLCDEHKHIKRPRSIIGRKIREHFGVNL